MTYFKSSLEHMNEFMAVFDKEHVENSLISFNLNQTDENDMITEILSNLNTINEKNTNSNTSPIVDNNSQRPSLEEKQSSSNGAFFLNPFKNSNLSRSALVKSFDNLYFSNVFQSSQKANSKLDLSFAMSTNSNSNSNSSSNSTYAKNTANIAMTIDGNSKIGYLFKKTHNSRVRKYWMKRKCQVDSGHFSIFHSDVSRTFLCLN